MRPLTWQRVRPFLSANRPPCLSLYQPTHRSYPDDQQDPIRFRNLLRTLEAGLAAQYPAVDARKLLRPLRQLAEDAKFWADSLDGLAILADAERMEVFQLQGPTPELALVADHFHVKPLLFQLRAGDRYQVLLLSRDRAQMLEGHRQALDPLPLPEGFPATLTEALGTELTESTRLVASTAGGVGSPVHFHGQGSRAEAIESDTERYFRAVDRAVDEHFSKPSGRPLLLAALAEHQGTFRQLTHNRHLMPVGVVGDPHSIPLGELTQRAWQVVEPTYRARLADLQDRFQMARSRQQATADLSDAARAAVAGQVATLLVAADARLPGHIDRATGAVTLAESATATVDDAINELAELVLSTGGEVHVVPAGEMPMAGPLAAIYRFS